MEFQIAERSDKTLTVCIKDPQMTMITLLVDRLTADKNVTSVRYIEVHPELEEPALVMTTSKGKPEAALAKAAGEVADYFSAVKKS